MNELYDELERRNAGNISPAYPISGVWPNYPDTDTGDALIPNVNDGESDVEMEDDYQEAGPSSMGRVHSLLVVYTPLGKLAPDL